MNGKSIMVRGGGKASSGEGKAYEALVVGDEVVARIAMGIGVTLGWRSDGPVREGEGGANKMWKN